MSVDFINGCPTEEARVCLSREEIDNIEVPHAAECFGPDGKPVYIGLIRMFHAGAI